MVGVTDLDGPAELSLVDEWRSVCHGVEVDDDQPMFGKAAFRSQGHHSLTRSHFLISTLNRYRAIIMFSTQTLPSFDNSLSSKYLQFYVSQTFLHVLPPPYFF